MTYARENCFSDHLDKSYVTSFTYKPSDLADRTVFDPAGLLAQEGTSDGHSLSGCGLRRGYESTIPVASGRRMAAGMANPGVPTNPVFAVRREQRQGKEPLMPLKVSTNSLVVVMGLSGLFGGSIQSLLSPLLPQIQQVYGLDLAGAAWLFNAMLLGLAVGVAILPRLTDVIGDRPMAMLCPVAIMVGCLLLATLSWYPALLIGAGGLGLGSSAIYVAMPILRRNLPAERLDLAVTVIIAAAGFGFGIGYVVGGLIMQAVPMRIVFVVMAAVALVGMIAVRAVVPATERHVDTSAGGWSGLLLVGWIAPLAVTIAQAPSWGVTDWRTVSLLAVSLVIAGGWVARELRIPQPLFDLRLFRVPIVTRATVAAFFVGAAFTGPMVVWPYLLQTPPSVGYGLGYDALQAGLVLLPSGISMSAGGFVAGRAFSRGTELRAGRLGGVALAAAFLLAVAAHTELWQFLVVAVLYGWGVGVATGIAIGLPQSMVEADQSGMAMSIVAIGNTLGTVIGTSTMIAVLSSSSVPDMPGVPTKGLFSTAFLVLFVFAALGVVPFLSRPATRPNTADHALARDFGTAAG
jgi:MFS family permease